MQMLIVIFTYEELVKKLLPETQDCTEEQVDKRISETIAEEYEEIILNGNSYWTQKGGKQWQTNL